LTLKVFAINVRVKGRGLPAVCNVLLTKQSTRIVFHHTYDIHFILGLSSRKYAVKNIQRGFNYFL